MLDRFRLIRNCIIIIFVGAGEPRYLIGIDKSDQPAPPIQRERAKHSGTKSWFLAIIYRPNAMRYAQTTPTPLH